MKLRVLLFAVLIAFLAAPIYPTVMGCGSSGGATATAPTNNETPDADFDGDGIANADDPDDDNDGVLDVDDAFPFDADESSDFDGDGVGDNEDTDDDNDGVEDEDDLDSQDADLGSPMDAVWVSQTEGAPGAEGTIDDPVDTIGEALTIAAAEELDVYVVEGTYAEDVELTDGISMLGGFSLIDAEGSRTRDSENNVTVIEGDATGLFSFEFEHEGPMDIPFTVLIDSSDSILDGFTVEEDDSAGNIMVYNSSATVRNCTVNGANVGPREMAMQIAIMVDVASTKDQTVTISNNTINMPDMDGASDSRNLGVFALPSNLGDGLLQVNVLDNTINASGAAETTMPIYVVDNDSDPANDVDDDNLDVNLLARGNSINISGDFGFALGISAGVVIEGNFLPSSEEMVFVNSVDISENEIHCENASGLGGVCAGFSVGLVRESANIYNNLVTGSGDDSTFIGVISLISPTNIYNNTMSFDSATGGAVAFYLLMADDGFASLYTSSMGNVSNNIARLSVSSGSCEVIAGVFEMFMDGTDSEANRTRLSPKEFHNNSIYLDGSCGSKALYYDYQDTDPVTPDVQPLIITDVAVLNAKTGFEASDPMLVGGNISEDPMFTNAAAGDYTLQAGSPCIDTGYDLGDDWADILGVSRPQGEAFDMGAYEQ